MDSIPMCIFFVAKALENTTCTLPLQQKLTVCTPVSSISISFPPSAAPDSRSFLQSNFQTLDHKPRSVGNVPLNTQMKRWAKTAVLDSVFVHPYMRQIKVGGCVADTSKVKVHLDGTGVRKTRATRCREVPRSSKPGFLWLRRMCARR